MQGVTIIHLGWPPAVSQAGPENTKEEEATDKTTQNKPEDYMEEK